MNSTIGTLSIYMIVDLPASEFAMRRMKRVTVASIRCEYENARGKFAEFKDANPSLAGELNATFVCTEHL